jgi:amino acid adenylation domain-containing protein
MTLLAAFKALIYRYTRQEDVVIGTPIANRTKVEIEGLIGFFVNTLVLRTNLSGNPTFRNLLVNVREITLDAYTHQDLPFEKLVEELQPERNLSHSPLFQVMFAFQNTPRSDLKLHDLTLSRIDIDDGTAKFDLTLLMTEDEEGLSGSIEYNTDLFNDDTIGRMRGHYQSLLESIVADPEQHISELEFLTEGERQQILVEWNNNQKNYPEDKCIHRLFEEQAERTPDAVAVVFEDEHLTYLKLNERANQLAHYLRRRGVGPEVLVGICLERSMEMLTGLLGILKAGGAYVPLDPTYPKDRLEFMLEDAQLKVLLTQDKFMNKLPESMLRVVSLDVDWGVISREKEDNPAGVVKADNLAYVIYTSGSTGKPKGVAMGHRALTNLIFWQLQNSTFPKGMKTLQFTSLSFDVSFQEIFSTWCSGGTLVLVSEEIRRDPMALLHFLKEKEIERLFLPFVALQQLAESVDSGFVPTRLRQIITAGEKLQITPAIASLFEKMPDCSLHNQYGPSETHVVTSFSLTGPVISWPALPPIGLPISNTEIYILDPGLNPVPVGVQGELYIGGDGLARGYLNRPELTAEKFINNTFRDSSSERLYKTGDLVRYLPDGNIEFLGRLDNQVKIRGFRVELGEIESVLTLCSGIAQAVVNVQEDRPGNRRLVAYVVLKKEDSSAIKEMRSFLRKKLPDYMVPSAFVILDKMPLSPSGKTDRRALPAPERAYTAEMDSFMAPRDALEIQLAKIWEKVLGIKSVGIQEDFFDLGGHSLLAVRLLTEIEKVLCMNLPLATIFQAKTIEQLAEVLRNEERNLLWSTMYAIQTDGHSIPFFWVQGRSSDAFLSSYLGPDQPLYGLSHQSMDGKRARYNSVEDIAAHYLREIRTVQPVGPYCLGGYCSGGLFAFEMAQQLLKQGEEVALLFLLEPGLLRQSSVYASNPAVKTNSTSLKDQSFYSWIGRHFTNLSHLRFSEKISYVSVRIKGIITYKVWQTKFMKKLKWIACEAYFSLGLPLPSFLRTFYILDVLYLKASRNYSRLVYPGRIILFLAENGVHPINKDWSNFASGGVEVHVVPEAGHVDVVKEPYVDIWAKHLKTYLDEAQANSLGKKV